MRPIRLKLRRKIFATKYTNEEEEKLKAGE